MKANSFTTNFVEKFHPTFSFSFFSPHFLQKEKWLEICLKWFLSVWLMWCFFWEYFLRLNNVDDELRMAWCGGRKFDAYNILFWFASLNVSFLKKKILMMSREIVKSSTEILEKNHGKKEIFQRKRGLKAFVLLCVTLSTNFSQRTYVLTLSKLLPLCSQFLKPSSYAALSVL